MQPNVIVQGGMVMSLRVVVSIAASFVIAIACIAIVSTNAFAAPAGMNRLHHHHTHHHGTVHHSGQVRHPRTPPATTMQR
jgi:hypothetical protein